MKRLKRNVAVAAVFALMLASFTAGVPPTTALAAGGVPRVTHVPLSMAHVQSNLAVTENGNGYTATLPPGGVAGSTYGNIVYSIPYSQWSGQPYLTFDLSAASTAQLHIWLYWNNQTWFNTPYSFALPVDYNGITSIDLSGYVGSHEGDTLAAYVIPITDTFGETLVVNDVYTATAAIDDTPSVAPYEYTSAGIIPYDTIVTNHADGSFTASVPGSLATGYTFMDIPVTAAMRANNRYMQLAILSGTANLHIWSYWKSTGQYTALQPLNNAAPSAYTGTLSMDMQSVTPPAHGDTLVIRLVILGPASGAGAAGNTVTIGSIRLSIADTLRLLPRESANPALSNDGGWYTAIGSIQAQEHGANGLCIKNTQPALAKIVWAVPAARLARTPYLVWEVDPGANTQQYVSLLCYDLGMTTGVKTIFDWTDITAPGRITVDVLSRLGTQNPNQYVYFELTLLGGAPAALALEALCLSSRSDGVLPGPYSSYFEVRFETYSAITAPSQMVAYGGLADAGPYTAGGMTATWYADSSLTVPYNGSLPVKGPLTLHASWKADYDWTVPTDPGTIGTTGLYTWDDNPSQHAFWKASGIDTLQFCDLGWYFNADTRYPTLGGMTRLEYYLQQMQQGIASAKNSGFKVYVILFSNIEQYHGPYELNPNPIGTKFHPDNIVKLNERLQYLTMTIAAANQADGFTFFAGDPGGIPDGLGVGNVDKYINMARSVADLVRIHAPQARFNLNPWAVSMFQTPTLHVMTADYWLQETAMTKSILARTDLIGNDIGIELAAYDYYRPLTLRLYHEENKVPAVKYPQAADINVLKLRQTKNIWAWPYFLLDEADDGDTGPGNTQLMQIETRYIYDYLQHSRQLGFNGVIGSWSYGSHKSKSLNTYAFGRFCNDIGATPDKVVYEFAQYVATPETSDTLAQILRFIENDSNFEKKLPASERLPKLGTRIQSAAQAIALLGTVAANAGPSFPLAATPTEYLADVQARLQAML